MKLWLINHKRLIIIAVAITLPLLMILVTISILLLSKKEGRDSILEILNPGKCTTEKTTFTVPPINVDDITSIIPLGNLNPSGHTFPTGHMYYNIRKEDPDDFNSPTIDAPLYAPIDATIEDINVMTHTNANPPSTDYSINFRTCEDFTFYFIHVTSLSDKILNEIDLEDEDCNEYSTGGMDYRNCWKEVNLEVKAGDVLGTVGSGMRGNFDFGVVDFRITPHVYANPDRWEENHQDKFYKVCSTDYYTGQLKQTLESKLKDFSGNSRTIEPICGTIAQDVPGTAQGLWVLKGTDNVSGDDLHMALVHSNFDPSVGVFSIGTSLEGIGIKSGTYNFDPKQSGVVNLDFDLVKPGSQFYCYEVGGSFHDQDNSFSILIQLPSEDILRIGRFESHVCDGDEWEFEEFGEFER